MMPSRIRIDGCERPAVGMTAAGMPRAAFLSGLIGAAWAPGACGPDAWDCWHLAQHVERELFGRELPSVAVPAAPSWTWIIETIAAHGERARWFEAPAESFGVIAATDGAIVLMARCDRPAHIGIWLALEAGIIHADARIGVTFQNPSMVKAAGWRRLRFFEPIA